MPPRLLILTAVEPEARALARAFSLRPCPRSTELPSLWQKDSLSVAVAGVRAREIEAIGREMAGFGGLIMAGLAGALSPELAVGSVVLDGFQSALGLGEEVVLGRLHTSRSIVSTADEKAALFKSTGCVAVDMETDIAAAFAAKRGAAFLAVRGISDSAHEALDPALLSLIDDRGRPRVGRAAAMVLKRPGKLPAMLRLGRSSARAMAAVAEVVGKIVASGWPDGPSGAAKG